MATSDKAKMEISHTICLEGRKHLRIDGIEDVISYDENGMLLKTACGTLTVDGAGLHIVVLSVEKGELTVEGHICGLYYVDKTVKKSSFFQRKSDK